ncbi:calcium-binding protein [Pseudoponticoccus marisrubri]|uniref:Calcium-binding protein n=1 Tax=Pseudoponticoccus marisrubri TaxID=1685382 RepID=A0A0W7WNQ6_9RHOB|nr:calcium-binding protein [Pseudoponticoccus marisrubri]KUF12161.1 hypothetical protein AVJ23_00010 [Pseudoponticoccus marisrubri]
MAKLKGDRFDNVIDGTLFDDIIKGKAGNDILSGLAGNDIINGGKDDDRLFGNDGDDFLIGKKGKDYLDGGAGKDVLDGGRGEDELRGGSEDDVLIGGAAGDTLFGDDGNDILIGDKGLVTASGAIKHLGGGSDESGGSGFGLSGGSRGSDGSDGSGGSGASGEHGGSDYLNGGIGDDILIGGAAGDALMGGEGADILIGDNGEVTSAGAVLADPFVGKKSDNDVLDGGEGDDLIFGQNGDDTILGGTDDGSIEVGGLYYPAGFNNDPVDLADIANPGDFASVEVISGNDRIGKLTTLGDLPDGDNVFRIDNFGPNSVETTYIVDLVGGGEFEITVPANSRTVINTGSANLTVRLLDEDRNLLQTKAANDNPISFDPVITIEVGDVLTGGDGADEFVYNVGDGVDEITDFELGIDNITLAGRTAADVSISVEDGNSLITFSDDPNGAILVDNVALTVDDLSF